MYWMMTLYMYVMGKPLPIVIPILWIVWLIVPDLFEAGGLLADVGTLLSQFGYVIYFGFIVYFVPTG